MGSAELDHKPSMKAFGPGPGVNFWGRMFLKLKTGLKGSRLNFFSAELRLTEFILNLIFLEWVKIYFSILFKKFSVFELSEIELGRGLDG